MAQNRIDIRIQETKMTNEGTLNKAFARKHYMPGVRFPYVHDELLHLLDIDQNWKEVLCPSSPYMCHDDRCGCRKSKKYRDVLR
jgi:hypothetical protein